MTCKKCGSEIGNQAEYCPNCVPESRGGRAYAKSFWGELEKNQTTIEEFGYRVKTEIRKSENTVVYVASNDAQETVAIKKITVPYSASDPTISDEALAERIRLEMDTLSRISSGNGNRFVITYYDYKLVENTDRLKYDLYIRMDYLTSLGQLYSDSKLTVKALLEMGMDICDALEWCHKNGRVHNNLNLNNIFINNEKRYVLGDFASFISKQNEVEYCIAPELFYGEKPSVGSDIYSLGMVLYVLLNNGLPPFAENGSEEALRFSVKRLKSGERPSLARPVNHRLGDLICKAIAPKEQRFGSVDEMKKALEFLLTSMPEEWLEQNINRLQSGENITEDLEPIPSEEIFDVSFEIEKTPEKDLAPEDAALKKKNRKDFWLIGIVAIVLIGAIAFGTVFLYNSGNRKIYSLIDSESYAVAFKEISGLQEKGQNVDDLLKTYIDACMSDSEYKRVVQALPLFSEEAYEDTEYFVALCRELLGSGRERQAAQVYEFLYEKENLRPELERLEEQ